MRPARLQKTLWLCSALVVVSAGAGCPHVLDQYTRRTAPLLSPAPTFAEIAAVVNERASRVTALHATKATIRGAGMPGITANIALERPRHFRLIAETGLTGAELDLGSNDELFWFWVRRSEPPALFFCRHAQFADSRARSLLPIEPQWLVEALGIVELDASAPHDGPRVVDSHRLAIQTAVRRPEGDWSRITILDAADGLVLEQHLSDPAGRPVASARAADHRRDPVTDVTLPRRLELDWPAARLKLELNLDELVINYPDDFTPELWSMPEGVAERMIDLGDPNTWPQAPPGEAAVRFHGEE